MQTSLKKIMVVDPLKAASIKEKLCLMDTPYLDLFIGTEYGDFMQSSPVLFEIDNIESPIAKECLEQKSAIILDTTVVLPQLQSQLSGLLTATHWQKGQVYLRWYSPSVLRSLVEHRSLLLSQLETIYLPNYNLMKWDPLSVEKGNEWVLFPLEEPWDALVEQCRLRYWLGVRNEWLQYPSSIELAANILQQVLSMKALSQLDLVAWSSWLSEQSSLLNHPQFIQICLQPIELKEKQSQVEDWRCQLSKEQSYV